MGEYGPPVDQLLSYAEEPDASKDWPDYLPLGFGPEHVPDLIRMATDRALHESTSESLEIWAPIHAWRTIGQLRAESAVGPLTRLLVYLGVNDFDDWVLAEVPTVLGMIGPAAIPMAAGLLEEPSTSLMAKSSAGCALVEVARRYPETRDECVAVLTRSLDRAESNEPEVNGFLIDNLLNLGANEAAVVIERVFAGGFVDESIVGGWYEVWHELDLEGEPPPRPERREPYFDDWDEGGDWEGDAPDVFPPEPAMRDPWQPTESRTPEERKDRNKARKKLEAKVKGKKKKR